MSRIRVARVIARMNVGGPALQVTGLMEDLDETRFDQRLYAGHVGADESDYLELRAPNVRVHRIAGLGRSVDATGDARAFARLVQELRALRPDVLHTHTAKAGVLGRAAARVVGVPIVVHTFHGHLLHGYFGTGTTRAVIGVERAMARVTTHLVAVGARVRDDLLAVGIGRPDRFSVVPPGVVLPASPPADEARRGLGVPPGVPVVAFVARLTQVKRPDRFAEVVARVASAVDDAVFVVAGEGDLLPDLRQRTAPYGDRVRFLGWRSDVEQVYAAADVVVLTSDNEGMPVSLIEAAAAGRPAVATDVGSTREVVEHGVTGLVVPTDPVEISAAVIDLLRDVERRTALGAAAAERAAARFSRARLVADTEALYESLLASNARRRSRRPGWSRT